MQPPFQELDRRSTPLGELTLWRRGSASTGSEAFYEVRLGGEFLMSSLVNVSEIALADLALAELTGDPLDVLVGGLGLGYTAKATLDNPNVRSVTVFEVLAPVIEWHRRGLGPLGRELTDDPRCAFVRADFFRWLTQEDRRGKSDPSPPDFHAILLDIDHSPACHLNPSHAAFYEAEGLRQLALHLVPGGVFALWSADPPDDSFAHALRTVFSPVTIHEVEFHNPLIAEQDRNWIYVARRGGERNEP